MHLPLEIKTREVGRDWEIWWESRLQLMDEVGDFEQVVVVIETIAWT